MGNTESGRKKEKEKERMRRKEKHIHTNAKQHTDKQTKQTERN